MLFKNFALALPLVLIPLVSFSQDRTGLPSRDVINFYPREIPSAALPPHEQDMLYRDRLSQRPPHAQPVYNKARQNPQRFLPGSNHRIPEFWDWTAPYDSPSFDDGLPQTPGSVAQQNDSGAVQKEWERYYASGRAAGDDLANSMVIDDYGNVYVTGTSTKLPYGLDICTIKYTASGSKEWEVRYDSDYDDFVGAMAIDDEGDIYITGYSKTNADYGYRYDIVTLKYNSRGTLLWKNNFNTPESYGNYGVAISVDKEKNIYVGGYGYVRRKGIVYSLIKYSADGAEQWVAHYEKGYHLERLKSMAMDNSGNIYLAGNFYNEYYNHDFLLIKLNPYGKLLWDQSYTDSDNSDEDVYAIKTGPAGNIYLNGYSLNYCNHNTKFITIKYDPDGQRIWLASFDKAQRINFKQDVMTIDEADNVYITGITSSANLDYDYVTIKYNTQGDEEWVSVYNSGGIVDDYAQAIAVDGSGNIYVSGYNFKYFDNSIPHTFTTVKYNPNGEEIWSACYKNDTNYDKGFSALGVDKSGNTYVSGFEYKPYRSNDYITIKYNKDGEEEWCNSYNGENTSKDKIHDLYTDASGNTFICGSTYIEGNSTDLLIAKYSPDGHLVWTTTYNGPASSMDYGRKIMLDKNGNIYTTGTIYETSSRSDITTLKLDKKGNIIWTARYGETPYIYDYVYAMALDSSGNVYVAGDTRGAESQIDFLTIKYDAMGNEKWTAIFTSPGLYDDHLTDLAVDKQGNVYVCGHISGIDTLTGYITVKYDNSGQQKWLARYEGLPGSYGYPVAIVVDDSSNVYVTGWSGGETSSSDFVTVKYDANGSEKWAARYNGAANRQAEAHDIAIDSKGFIYVSGYIMNPGNDFDFCTIKYDPSGNEQWVRTFDYPEGTYHNPYAMAIDKEDNVYVTGSGSGSNILTVKYSPEGNREWFIHYYYGKNYGYINPVKNLQIDGQGNIYQAFTYHGNGWSYGALLKYNQNTAEFTASKTLKTDSYELQQNFPNPFNAGTTFRFTLPRESHVKIEIFNTLGQKVADVLNANKSAGANEIPFDCAFLSSGVYYYRITVKNQKRHFLQTKKMLLIK